MMSIGLLCPSGVKTVADVHVYMGMMAFTIFFGILDSIGSISPVETQSKALQKSTNTITQFVFCCTAPECDGGTTHAGLDKSILVVAKSGSTSLI